MPRPKKRKKKKKRTSKKHRAGQLDLSEVIAIARRQGWKVVLTKNNHWRFKAPKGPVVFTSSTASDWRALQNHIARLRRAGLQI